ncbi:MAG TPA: bifunctional DNA-formamidopyrimidine glycosylase/DNA-(apurinic or apyrimidinic site) lyase [Thermomicrobiales bacterium]|nr:bifunctional DNA-formamidopyrimidine glycosylase/DNA-(apurinic or apyrimidinic site) lyase [Thermomicrobiales bacterium]
MPELPEVETMRRIVERELAGRELAAVEVRLPKLLRDSPMPDLTALAGRRVLGARRRAKVLVIDWSGDLTLLAHFKLAGQLAVVHPDGSRQVAGHPVPAPDGDYPHKATHVVFRFADGTVLYHSDIRQFGWLRLMPTADADRALAAFGFGEEGVGPDAIPAEVLRARLARRRIPIKQALLDQAVVAGLGNIYVDEALHHAGIHPARPANALTDDEFARLHTAIPWALERGIEQGGAKIVHGRAYPVDGFPAVHGREGEPCFRCGAAIVKTRVGGRGTYFCPVCQPEAAAG